MPSVDFFRIGRIKTVGGESSLLLLTLFVLVGVRAVERAIVRRSQIVIGTGRRAASTVTVAVVVGSGDLLGASHRVVVRLNQWQLFDTRRRRWRLIRRLTVVFIVVVVAFVSRGAVRRRVVGRTRLAVCCLGRRRGWLTLMLLLARLWFSHRRRCCWWWWARGRWWRVVVGRLSTLGNCLSVRSLECVGVVGSFIRAASPNVSLWVCRWRRRRRFRRGSHSRILNCGRRWTS